MAAVTLRRVFAYAAMLVAAGTVEAASCGMPQGALPARVVAAEVGPGAARVSLRLSTGTGEHRLLLAGLIVPDRATPEDRRATADLLAAGMPVAVEPEALAGRVDRHGRRSGRLWLADGRPVARDLLAAGLVVLDGGTACPDLVAAEREARDAGRGFWPRISIDAAAFSATEGAVPAFVLLRGRILTVGNAGRTTYLNFGRNFRQDATARFGPTVADALVASGRDPAGLPGREVLLRGFAGMQDGLDLPLADAAALEIVD